jgi:hypothetical protein
MVKNLPSPRHFCECNLKTIMEILYEFTKKRNYNFITISLDHPNECKKGEKKEIKKEEKSFALQAIFYHSVECKRDTIKVDLCVWCYETLIPSGTQQMNKLFVFWAQDEEEDPESFQSLIISYWGCWIRLHLSFYGIICSPSYNTQSGQAKKM